MNRTHTLFFFLIVSLFSNLLFAVEPQKTSSEVEGREILIDRMKWFLEGHKGPDGLIPADARNRAIRQLEQNRANRKVKPSSVGGDLWVTLGPKPLFIDGNPFSGRTTAIAADPTDPNIVYIGGAQGGIWKTNDAGVTWQPLTDDQVSLATGCITIDPNDHNTIYAGTGEANLSCGIYFGAGILKSTNAGSTWSVLGSSTFSNSSVSKIIVNPADSNILWASNSAAAGGFVCAVPSSTRGVWKSTDAGSTWLQTLGTAQTGTGASTTELVIDPSDNSILYAAVYASGIWKSTDGGLDWNKLTAGLPAGGFGRGELAIDPNNASIVYAAFSDINTGSHFGNYKSTDKGATWTTLPKPAGGTCMGASLADICTYSTGPYGGQCWYDFFLSMNKDGVLWEGGMGIFRSTNGGINWTSVCPSTVHVDQHAVEFNSGGKVYVGNDGGVFSTSDNGANWAQHNSGLTLTQFYPGASVHPLRNDFAIGGTQDNGTLKYTGVPGWQEIYGGDGAFSAIDPRDPDNTWYVSYYGLAIVKTTNGGATFARATSGIDVTSAAFIAPFAMCPSNPSILIAGTDNVWRTTNGAAKWSSNSPDPIDTTAYPVQTLAFVPSDTTCRQYFAGVLSGRLYRTLDAQTWTDVTGTLPPAGVSDLAIDPFNSSIAYAGISGFGNSHLFKSTDALAVSPIWTPSDAGLPDIPVNAVLIDPIDSNIVYAGTDLGVFRSTDAGATWGEFMNGLPRLAVYDLVTNEDTILAFTHGRGVFQLVSTNPDFRLKCSPFSITSKPGATANTTCTVTSLNGFTAPVDMSCAGLPAGSTCVFGSPSVTPPADGTVTTGVDIGIPLSASVGSSSFLVNATSVSSVRSRHIALQLIPASTLFYDDFEDGSASDWSFPKGTWSVNSGDLTGTTTKKAEAFAPFGGCSSCTVLSYIRLQSSVGRLSQLGWYQDNANYVELLFSNGKVLLKQRAGSTTVLRKSASLSFAPGTDYLITLRYNAGNFELEVDGNPVFSVAAPVIPFGNVGFRVNARHGSYTVGAFREILVY